MNSKNIYTFNTVEEKNKLREIKKHAKTVLMHELKAHLNETNTDKAIQSCLEHYYIPIDIWYNFNANIITPQPIKNYYILKLMNFIENGIYDLPKGSSI
jgi:hypothetical protein